MLLHVFKELVWVPGASPFTKRGRVWYTLHQRFVLLSQQILANKVGVNVNPDVLIK